MADEDDRLSPAQRRYQDADGRVIDIDVAKAQKEAAEKERAEREKAQKEAAEEEARGKRYKLEWFHDIQPCVEADDFVQGLLCDGSSAVVYGNSNAGKTFWVTDLALHVAAGLTWNGKRVEQGGVVYCALEGSKRFRNRIAAWRKEHDLTDRRVAFAAIQSSINLLSASEEDATVLIATIKDAQKQLDIPLRLVVIDTLARAMQGGNENGPEDMGKLIRAMDRIREETGVCVLFIHHSGKDEAKGMRGHTSLLGAIDTEIEVVEGEAGSRTAEVLKQRDLQKGDVFGFSLRQVQIGENRYGESVTSCVVDAVVAAPEASQPAHGDVRKAKREDPTQKERALEVLHNVLLETPASWAAGVPKGFTCCHEDAWRDRFYRDAMPGADGDAKRQAFYRASRLLIANKIVGMANNRVWICYQDTGP